MTSDVEKVLETLRKHVVSASTKSTDREHARKMILDSLKGTVHKIIPNAHLNSHVNVDVSSHTDPNTCEVTITFPNRPEYKELVNALVMKDISKVESTNDMQV